MRAVTIRQEETVPAAYPELPLSLFIGFKPAFPELRPPCVTDDALAFAWARVESYMAHRFAPRAVVWTVDGPGHWLPTLTPATVEAVEVWDGAAWSPTLALPSPYGGHELPGDGPYRVTATVGAGPVPVPVAKAVGRLVNYLSAKIVNADPQL